MAIVLSLFLTSSHNTVCAHDKATEVLILAFCAANRFDEAIALGLDLRKELGFKAIPTKPTTFTVLKEFFKTNRAIKGLSAEELASLPTCTDERAIIGQRMLELPTPPVYQANPPMYPLLTFTHMQETIKSGVISSSVAGFFCFGVVLM